MKLLAYVALLMTPLSLLAEPLSVTVSRGTVKPIVLALMDITPKGINPAPGHTVGHVVYDTMKKNFNDCGFI